MTTILLAIAALILSAVPLAMLCTGDPKRRRAAGAKDAMTSAQRWLLVGLACLPGLLCAVIGDAAAFIMWLGGSGVIGWATAACWPAGAKAGRR